jgi:hypothetical protein
MGVLMDKDIRHYFEYRCDTINDRVTELHQLTEAEIERRITALREKHDSDLTAMRDAVIAAQTSLEHRLEGMNEFRAEIADRQRIFATREMVDEAIRGLRAKDDVQQERLNTIDARTAGLTAGSQTEHEQTRDQRASTALIISGVSVFLVLVSVSVTVIAFITHK